MKTTKFFIVFVAHEFGAQRNRITTMHFMDALGRETNTVVTAVGEPGSAATPDCWTLGFAASETTTYPKGISDHAVHVDRRGVRTVSTSRSFADREESVVLTFAPTNSDVCVVASTNIVYRNGRSIAIQSWDGGWTRETSWSDYAADGARRAFSVTEASDSVDANTNQIAHSDFLGRTVATLTPGVQNTWLVSSNAYDGATSRIVRSETTRKFCGQSPNFSGNSGGNSGGCPLIFRYTPIGLLAGTTYSDSTPSTAFTYGDFKSLSSASNSVAACHYARNAHGMATNEVIVVGGTATTLTRLPDDRQRVGAIFLDGSLHAAYGYELGNRLGTISNAAFSVRYSSWFTSPAGYSIALANENVLTQTLQRERSRPEIVSRVVNAFNDVPIGQSVYTHDEISRRIQRLDSSGATTITNTFGYNTRSEVTPASILSNAYAYAYDHQSRRVTKWTPSYTTTFIYDGWKLVQELTHTQTHTLTNLYVWAKICRAIVHSARQGKTHFRSKAEPRGLPARPGRCRGLRRGSLRGRRSTRGLARKASRTCMRAASSHG